ncbi:MAG: hypothetical protein ACRD4E_07330 [Bryobacteraceae bacterium]
MKRASRFLIRLYPAWWRRRYGKELEALVEDSGSHDVWDLLRGAMKMQLKTWSFTRIASVCGMGIAVSAVAVFLFPPPYSSTAILRVSGEDEPAGNLADKVNDAAVAAMSRNSLGRIITTQNLYLQERKRMQMESVIEVMRRAIQITPVLLANGKTKINGIVVRFNYPDASKTQPVTRALAERFSNFQVLDPPSAPQRLRENYDRFRLALLGLLAGLSVGVGLALFWPKYRSKEPGEILTPLKRFFLCFAISVSTMAFCAILADQLFRHPLAWRFHQIVFLPLEYLVEGFGLRPTVINLVVGFLFCTLTWTGILYAFVALVESSLRKITRRTTPQE